MTRTRFAFAGRVSTEDQQDPEASRNWQLARAWALIEGRGQIVTEFFDIGQSRSIPWKRRPEGGKLLELLRDPNRGFDAVVIGEPQRAFYGNQFGLTFPIFVHYGVELWVPEVGGPIDPDSEAHDLIMSVFAGMSKGERHRIQVRVHAAMTAQARAEGRYLGGRPPYGYRLADAGPHPNPGKAADGIRLHRLEPDPVAAPIVRRIFDAYLRGAGIFAIARQLTVDGIACPSTHDRARNRHRSAHAWSKSAVRTILTNPRYTGHEVWNKQHRQESLIDVEDVGLGDRTRLTWNDREQWVFSDRPAHEALVDRPTFDQVQQRLAAQGPTSTGRATTTRKHDYAFKSLIVHQTCGRRMQGNWNHGTAHYRCRYPTEYALANNIDHPSTVYLREDRIIGPLDEWLTHAFAPGRIEHDLAASPTTPSPHTPAIDEAEARLAQQHHKLDKYRDALEAGADPELVAQWTREVLGELHSTEARLMAMQQQGSTADSGGKHEIDDINGYLNQILDDLRRAEPADKLRAYRELGLRLTYSDTSRMLYVEARPARVPIERVWTLHLAD